MYAYWIYNYSLREDRSLSSKDLTHSSQHMQSSLTSDLELNPRTFTSKYSFIWSLSHSDTLTQTYQQNKNADYIGIWLGLGVGWDYMYLLSWQTYACLNNCYMSLSSGYDLVKFLSFKICKVREEYYTWVAY